MGKTSKKTAPEAEAVAPAVAAKPLNKGKRKAEEVIEKEISKKKQKKEVEEVIEKEISKKKHKKDVGAKETTVKKVEVKTEKKKVEVKTEKKKIVKKQESSDDSSSSESEEEQKVIEFTMNIFTGIVKTTAAVKNGTAKNKVKDDFDSDSEDDTSEDDVPEAKKVAAAKTKSGPVKMDVDESNDDSESEDSSSDDDAPPKKVPAAVAKKATVVAKNKKEETSDDTDSEDDSSEDDVPEAKKVAATKTQDVPVKMDKYKSSDESESDDSSSDDTSIGFQVLPGRTVYVRGFYKNAEENDMKNALRKHFSSCGEVTRIDVPSNENGGLKGFAYIDFNSSDAFRSALRLDHSELNEYDLSVQDARGYTRNNGRGHGPGRIGNRRPFQDARRRFGEVRRCFEDRFEDRRGRSFRGSSNVIRHFGDRRRRCYFRGGRIGF